MSQVKNPDSLQGKKITGKNSILYKNMLIKTKHSSVKGNYKKLVKLFLKVASHTAKKSVEIYNASWAKAFSNTTQNDSSLAKT